MIIVLVFRSDITNQNLGLKSHQRGKCLGFRVARAVSTLVFSVHLR